MTEIPNMVSEELVVYFVFSPEWGRGHRVYTDEDIQAAGGIQGIEQALEKKKATGLLGWE